MNPIKEDEKGKGPDPLSEEKDTDSGEMGHVFKLVVTNVDEPDRVVESDGNVPGVNETNCLAQLGTAVSDATSFKTTVQDHDSGSDFADQDDPFSSSKGKSPVTDVEDPFPSLKGKGPATSDVEGLDAFQEAKSQASPCDEEVGHSKGKGRAQEANDNSWNEQYPNDDPYGYYESMEVVMSGDPYGASDSAHSEPVHSASSTSAGNTVHSSAAELTVALRNGHVRPYYNVQTPGAESFGGETSDYFNYISHPSSVNAYLQPQIPYFFYQTYPYAFFPSPYTLVDMGVTPQIFGVHRPAALTLLPHAFADRQGEESSPSDPSSGGGVLLSPFSDVLSPGIDIAATNQTEAINQQMERPSTPDNPPSTLTESQVQGFHYTGFGCPPDPKADALELYMQNTSLMDDYPETDDEIAARGKATENAQAGPSSEASGVGNTDFTIATEIMHGSVPNTENAKANVVIRTNGNTAGANNNTVHGGMSLVTGSGVSAPVDVNSTGAVGSSIQASAHSSGAITMEADSNVYQVRSGERSQNAGPQIFAGESHPRTHVTMGSAPNVQHAQAQPSQARIAAGLHNAGYMTQNGTAPQGPARHFVHGVPAHQFNQAYPAVNGNHGVPAGHPIPFNHNGTATMGYVPMGYGPMMGNGMMGGYPMMVHNPMMAQNPMMTGHGMIAPGTAAHGAMGYGGPHQHPGFFPQPAVPYFSSEHGYYAQPYPAAVPHDGGFGPHMVPGPSYNVPTAPSNMTGENTHRQSAQNNSVEPFGPVGQVGAGANRYNMTGSPPARGASNNMRLQSVTPSHSSARLQGRSAAPDASSAVGSIDQGYYQSLLAHPPSLIPASNANGRGNNASGSLVTGESNTRGSSALTRTTGTNLIIANDANYSPGHPGAALALWQGPPDSPSPPTSFGAPSGTSNALDIRVGIAQVELSMSDIAANLPFFETSALVKPSLFGIVKIGNLPEIVHKSEIGSFFGIKAPLAEYPTGSGNHGIHLIMDRIEGNVTDVYVEFESLSHACGAIAYLESWKSRGRPKKISAQVPSVVMSSQEELMSVLFNRTYGVKWDGQKPIIEMPTAERRSRFRGFLSDEVLHHFRSYADNPRRSQLKPQRPVLPFLTFLSLVQKFPWGATAFYTMHERQQILLTYIKCLTALDSQTYTRLIGPSIGNVRKDYIVTGLSCPGFTEFERVEIRRKFPMRPLRSFKEPEHIGILENWPFYALHMNPEADLTFLRVVVSLLHRAETEPDFVPFRYIINRARAANSPFGFTRDDVWPKIRGESSDGLGDAGSLSMAQVAEIEFAIVQDAIYMVIGVRDGRIKAPVNATGIGGMTGLDRFKRLR